jgi:hypothetical protein
MCYGGNQKREEPKLPKSEMVKQIMTVRWRRTRNRDPCTWERGDKGAIERELSRVPKRCEAKTLAVDGLDALQRSVHSGKIVSEKIKRRSVKTLETQNPK